MLLLQCYTTKRNIRTVRLHNVRLQTKEWTWVNCKLITASHQNS